MSNAIKENDSLKVKGKINFWIFSFDVASTGLYAGMICCIIAALGLFVYGEPLKNVQHAFLCWVAVFIGGIFLGIGIQVGRVNLLRYEVENRNNEITILTTRIKELETKLFSNRQSSTKKRG